jgi:putative membrane protein
VMMGFGMLGLVLMLLFWGVLIALAAWAIGALFPIGRVEHTAPPAEHLNARQILEQRYARGELAREQYELNKQDLS